jgi:MFS family permease
VVSGGVLFTVLGLLLLSQVTSLAMFYVAFVLMSIGISSLGVSVTVTAVSNWFRKRLGLATGIMISGYGTSGLLVPIMVSLIDAQGWRTAIVIMALGLLVLGLPLAMLLRHKPEQYGLLPDGEAGSAVLVEQSLTATRAKEAHLGIRQVMKTRAFWHIVLGLMPQFVVVPAAITHLMPYLSSLGIARATSGLVATAIPLLSIGGRFGFGWLADKHEKRRLSMMGLILLLVGLVCFEYISTGWPWLLVPFLIFFSFGYGGNVTMIGVLLGEYFGRGNLGTLIGFAWGTLMVANMAGPPIAGAVFDHWGSYQGVWLAMAGLTLAGVVVMALMPAANRSRLLRQA